MLLDMILTDAKNQWLENPLVRVFLRQLLRWIYEPQVRNQSTPVNHYTTGGFPWEMDFPSESGKFAGRIIYIPSNKSFCGRGYTEYGDQPLYS